MESASAGRRRPIRLRHDAQPMTVKLLGDVLPKNLDAVRLFGVTYEATSRAF